jgi:glycogen synthase
MAESVGGRSSAGSPGALSSRSTSPLLEARPLSGHKVIHITQEGGDKRWKVGGVGAYVTTLSEQQARLYTSQKVSLVVPFYIEDLHGANTNFTDDSDSFSIQAKLHKLDPETGDVIEEEKPVTVYHKVINGVHVYAVAPDEAHADYFTLPDDPKAGVIGVPARVKEAGIGPVERFNLFDELAASVVKYLNDTEGVDVVHTHNYGASAKYLPDVATVNTVHIVDPRMGKHPAHFKDRYGAPRVMSYQDSTITYTVSPPGKFDAQGKGQKEVELRKLIIAEFPREIEQMVLEDTGFDKLDELLETLEVKQLSGLLQVIQQDHFWGNMAKNVNAYLQALELSDWQRGTIVSKRIYDQGRITSVISGISDQHSLDSVFTQLSEEEKTVYQATQTVAAKKECCRQILSSRLTEMHLEWKLDPAKPVVTYIGRITIEKGAGFLEDSLKACQAKGVNFVIMGIPTGPGMQELCDDLQRRYPDVPIMTTMDAQGEIGNIVRSATDVGLCLSHHEAFGLILAEHQAYGASVVSANVGGVAYAIGQLDGEALEAAKSDAIIKGEAGIDEKAFPDPVCGKVFDLSTGIDGKVDERASATALTKVLSEHLEEHMAAQASGEIQIRQKEIVEKSQDRFSSNAWTERVAEVYQTALTHKIHQQFMQKAVLPELKEVRKAFDAEVTRASGLSVSDTTGSRIVSLRDEEPLLD